MPRMQNKSSAVKKNSHGYTEYGAALSDTSEDGDGQASSCSTASEYYSFSSDMRSIDSYKSTKIDAKAKNPNELMGSSQKLMEDLEYGNLNHEVDQMAEESASSKQNSLETKLNSKAEKDLQYDQFHSKSDRYFERVKKIMQHTKNSERKHKQDKNTSSNEDEGIKIIESKKEHKKYDKKHKKSKKDKLIPETFKTKNTEVILEYIEKVKDKHAAEALKPTESERAKDANKAKDLAAISESNNSERIVSKRKTLSPDSIKCDKTYRKLRFSKEEIESNTCEKLNFKSAETKVNKETKANKEQDFEYQEAFGPLAGSIQYQKLTKDKEKPKKSKKKSKLTDEQTAANMHSDYAECLVHMSDMDVPKKHNQYRTLEKHAQQTFNKMEDLVMPVSDGSASPSAAETSAEPITVIRASRKQKAKPPAIDEGSSDTNESVKSIIARAKNLYMKAHDVPSAASLSTSTESGYISDAQKQKGSAKEIERKGVELDKDNILSMSIMGGDALKTCSKTKTKQQENNTQTFDLTQQLIVNKESVDCVKETDYDTADTTETYVSAKESTDFFTKDLPCQKDEYNGCNNSYFTFDNNKKINAQQQETLTLKSNDYNFQVHNIEPTYEICAQNISIENKKTEKAELSFNHETFKRFEPAHYSFDSDAYNSISSLSDPETTVWGNGYNSEPLQLLTLSSDENSTDVDTKYPSNSAESESEADDFWGPRVTDDQNSLMNNNSICSTFTASFTIEYQEDFVLEDEAALMAMNANGYIKPLVAREMPACEPDIEGYESDAQLYEQIRQVSDIESNEESDECKEFSIPPLDITSDEYHTQSECENASLCSNTLPNTSAKTYTKTNSTVKLPNRNGMSYEDWLKNKQKMELEKKQRLKMELEKKKQDEEARKRYSREQYAKWLENKNKSSAQDNKSISNKSVSLQNNLSPEKQRELEAQKKAKLAAWERKKALEAERMKRLKQQEEQLRKRKEVERAQQSKNAFDNWLSGAAARQRPVPLNQGMDTLRSAMKIDFVQPKPWVNILDDSVTEEPKKQDYQKKLESKYGVAKRPQKVK